MKYPQRGFVPALLLAFVAVLLLGIGTYVHTQKTENTQPALRDARTASSTEETPRISGDSGGLAEQISFSNITPRFVPGGEGKEISRELITIQSAARSILAQTEPDIAPNVNDAKLQAVGQRYCLLRVFNHGAGYVVNGDFVIDFVDRTSTRISSAGDLDLYTQDAVVYISPGQVRYYKVDSPSVVVLPSSELPAGQTYDAGYVSRNTPIETFTPQENHRNNLLTISIFDSTTFIALPDNPQFEKMHVKLREVTLTLPTGEILFSNG